MSFTEPVIDTEKYTIFLTQEYNYKVTVNLIKPIQRRNYIKFRILCDNFYRIYVNFAPKSLELTPTNTFVDSNYLYNCGEANKDNWYLANSNNISFIEVYIDPADQPSNNATATIFIEFADEG